MPFTAQKNNLHLPPWKLWKSSQICQALAGCWQINDSSAGKNAVTAYTAQSSVTMVSPLPLCLQTKKESLLCSYTDRTVQCRAWQSPLGTCTAFGKDDKTLRGHCSVQGWWWGWHLSSLAAGKALNTKCPTCQWQRLCVHCAMHSTLQTSTTSHCSGPPQHQMFLYIAQRLSFNSSKWWIHNFSWIKPRRNKWNESNRIPLGMLSTTL